MLTIEGNIVNNGINRKRIEINDAGVITSVSDSTGTADIVFNEELIFPGFIDLHVHAREDMSHTQEYKEDFTTASEAAINGGVVAFAEMPNNPIPPVDDISYDAKNNLAEIAIEKTNVEIVLYAGIGEETNPLTKKVPYKVFMGQSIGNMFFTNKEDLEKALEKYQVENVSFHCEDPKIMEEEKGALTHESRRPAVAETSAVDIALKLIEKFNLTGKICHCSTVEGIEKIVEAKKRGVKVTVEVTPHHLFFDETMFTDESRTLFQVNPPIRQTKENRLGLIKMLKDGDIDYLATDHAPHTIEEKEKGMSGLTHLDTYGPFTTWLMNEHDFTAEDIRRVCSENPGKFINEFTPPLTPPHSNGEGKNTKTKYGKIEVGYVGSLSVIDLKKEIQITKESLKTKSKWSPFLGMSFSGSVVVTIIKGKIMKNDLK